MNFQILRGLIACKICLKQEYNGCLFNYIYGKINDMKLWDYKISKNWQPKTREGWIWYLERNINYGDWKGLKPKIIKKYFKWLKLDEGKRLMLKFYFAKYGTE